MSLFAFEIEVGRGGGANKAKIFIGSKGIDMISEWDQSLFVYCSPTSLIYRWWQVRILVGNIEFPAGYSKDLGP